MSATDKNLPEKSDQLKADESLPPFVAYQVEEESREKVPASSGVANETYRRGRLEAETKRVSDEVTREAQRRQRAAQSDASEASAVTVTPPVIPATKPTFPRKTNLPTPKSLKHFFVPVDGTAQGERALPYAATLARMLNAHVLLGHVTPTEPPAMLGHLLGLADSERQVAQQAFAPEALPYLRQLRDKMSADGQQADTLHITAPSVAEGLIEMETSHNIDLAFLSVSSHGDAGRPTLGTVADKLIRLGNSPVLVIPPDADPAVHPFVLRHILVTLDGSTLSEQVIGPLQGLLGQLQEQQAAMPVVTLFAVAEDFAIEPDYQSYLEALSGTLAKMPQFAGLQLHTQVAVGSAPGAIVGALEHGIRDGSLADQGKTPPVDLLMMTTHGRGGMSRWLFGSVANYVLPRVHVPVLLTHPESRAKQ